MYSKRKKETDDFVEGMDYLEEVIDELAYKMYDKGLTFEFTRVEKNKVIDINIKINKNGTT
jgi:hypothetical protein